MPAFNIPDDRTSLHLLRTANSGWSGDEGYVQALLNMVALGLAGDIYLWDKMPVPPLASLSGDSNRLTPWLDGVDFRYERLSAKKIVASIKRAAGMRWHHFSKRDGVCSVRMPVRSGVEGEYLIAVCVCPTSRKMGRGVKLYLFDFPCGGQGREIAVPETKMS